ncbi:MAG: cytochrome b5-like heme/steroid binding domain-containing protein [Candidatus Gracilibacteria bacterium]|jgi:cytochrome b involved in lipid metabolism
MKKITWATLIFFFGVIVTIYTFSAINKSSASIENVSATPIIPVTQFTTTEVTQHNTANDCYLIIDTKVYDVSNYINKHPGGKSSITNTCGGEASTIFAAIHSNFAWNLLKDYYVGELIQ